jgi:hypothetical protein
MQPLGTPADTREMETQTRWLLIMVNVFAAACSFVGSFWLGSKLLPGPWWILFGLAGVAYFTRRAEHLRGSG